MRDPSARQRCSVCGSSGSATSVTPSSVPSRPGAPGSPAGPHSPGGPAGPVLPDAPDSPAGPAGPAGPIGPDSPAGPTGPTRPGVPGSPAGPLGPAGPVSPRSPGGPGPAARVSSADMRVRIGPIVTATYSRTTGTMPSITACSSSAVMPQTPSVPVQPPLHAGAPDRCPSPVARAGLAQAPALALALAGLRADSDCRVRPAPRVNSSAVACTAYRRL